MMQTANVKQVAKPELIGKVYVPALSQKADKAKESDLVDSPKQPNYSRMFEAYNDCV